ncbi:hypothetical protein [Pseudomonas sp. D(2018)]|uniref:hypothetical protein n=1 Tax=Pseudomonas sp. D(2018) TaxID=2502238 RepID=UPI0010FA23EB|nr:hypothetical protein [Pseudomonas sp. D(2018)]
MVANRRKAKGRSPSGTYAVIPHVVMDSEDFLAISGAALRVLLGLLRQFRGANNGNLSATIQQSRVWGVKSPSTLVIALQELMDRNLIIRTRDPKYCNPGGICALYALSWLAIDECGGRLDVDPTATPPRKFSLEESNHPVRKSKSTTSKIEVPEAV